MESDLSQRAVPVRGRLLGLLVRRLGLVAVVPFLEHEHRTEFERYSREPLADAALLAAEAGHLADVGDLAPRWRARVSGTLRAAVFGVSDGLVSNLALVMGVLGAGSDRTAVLVAGVAGLLAGALSMAAGEYVSVASQQEILVADGPPPTDDAGDDDAGAGEAAEAVGSPGRAAGTSFVTFATGAVVPLVPFLFGSGLAAGLVAIALAGLAMVAVGWLLGVLSGVPTRRTIARQVGLGIGAAVATLLIGRLLGVAVS